MCGVSQQGPQRALGHNCGAPYTSGMADTQRIEFPKVIRRQSCPDCGADSPVQIWSVEDEHAALVCPEDETHNFRVPVDEP